jgi:hypothetical protein
MGLKRLLRGVHHRHQQVGDRLGGIHCCAQSRLQITEPALQQRHKHGLLALKVIIKRPFADPSARAQFRHAGGVVAARGKTLLGGLQDRDARFLTALLLSHNVFVKKPTGWYVMIISEL